MRTEKNRPRRTKSILLGLAILLVASCVFPSDAGNATTHACAHRGDVAVAPENTIPAFASAVRKGASQIEFDLRLTSDGRLVILHDDTLDRTTDGTGRVSEATFEYVRGLDAGAWFSDEFKGTRVPTFRETLEAIPETVLCNCHLKGPPEIGAEAAKVVREMNCEDHCFLAATIEQAKAAKEILPNLRICNMSRQAGPDSSYPDQTIELGCEFIQLLGSFDGLAETVEKLHANGVKVNFFHGSTKDRIETLSQAGVDYILTDNLDLCLEVLAQSQR